MFYTGKRTRNNLLSTDPIWLTILEKALSYDIIDIGVPDKAGRTKQDQADLYAQGRTKPGKIVTWTLNSEHLIDPTTGFGRAVDFVPYVNRKYSWNEKHCLLMATVILKAAHELGVDIDWGYHLWKKDMPHFHLRKEG